MGTSCAGKRLGRLSVLCLPQLWSILDRGAGNDRRVLGAAQARPDDGGGRGTGNGSGQASTGRAILPRAADLSLSVSEEVSFRSRSGGVHGDRFLRHRLVREQYAVGNGRG